MPVYLNEPLSMLQKSSIYIEYKDIWKKASETEDPFLRCAYVLGGDFMKFGNVLNRFKKPFNPLKGETFEYIDGDM